MSLTKKKEGSLLTGTLTYGYLTRGLLGSGLAEGVHRTNEYTIVWILSSTTLPQPAGTRGQWDDSASWSDTNVWYD